MKRMLRTLLGLFFIVGAASVTAAEPFNPSPHAIDIPQWFKPSFLDFQEDIAQAARAGKRLMVYFGQDGCPYCRELMRVNFSQKEIVDKTRKHFDAVALNIWGDREVTWLDRKVYSEKAFAALLGVQFTPTVIFFDEKGKTVLRLNGYYPPHKFSAALDYVGGRHETRTSFSVFLARHVREPATGTLHDQPFFMPPPYTLVRTVKSGKPLAVFFEQKDCAACDELHRAGFEPLSALLGKFDVVRLELFGQSKVVTPARKQTTEGAWARDLNVLYTPSIIFFDSGGKEVFRVEGFLRPFHLASSFEYVASGAYRMEPNFQRYVQARAQKIREAGGRVELW